MRDAGRQAADRLHLLRLVELFLRLPQRLLPALPFRDVLKGSLEPDDPVLSASRTASPMERTQIFRPVAVNFGSSKS